MRMENFESVHQIISKLSDLSKEVHQVLQDPFFESWALSTKIRLERKLAASDFAHISRIFLGSHLQHARPLDSKRELIHLADDFLLAPPKEIPQNSVFLLLNNDVARYLPQYIEFYNNHPEALFVIWDWDSQHWIYMSSILALNSDFYISASSEHAYLLSQFNPYVLGPVFAAAHQWSRKFIIEHIELFLDNRLNEPLGKHVYYETYPRRNRAIATVTPVYPSVGFANNDFKARSEMENFKEWAQHKTHWIVPVLAGVPIRVYNALITGGIPILPAFYKNLPEIAILGDVPLYHEVADLLEPKMINDAAVAKFDAAGESGLIQRIAYAVEHHHVDARCEHIFLALENSIGKILNSDRSHDLGYLGSYA